MNHVSNGELEEAHRCFSRAVSADPHSAALRVNLANTAARLGRIPEAIREYAAALERDPENITALLNLGSVYLDEGKPRSALPLLRRAHRLAPHDDDILKRNLLAEARAGSAEEIGRSLRAVPAKKCTVTAGIGQELLARGLYEVAATQFSRERHCNASSLTPLLGEASALLALGRSEDAIDLLHSRHEQTRANKYARWILGSAYERRGRYRESFEQFSAAVDIDPNDARAYVPLGLLGIKAGTPQLSHKVFQDAIARFPAAPEFRLGQALIAQVTGNARQAEETCRALIAKNPKYMPAHLFLSALLLDANRHREVLAHLEKLLHEDPSNLLALHLRAAAQFHLTPDPSSTLAGFMTALKGALDSRPDFADGHILLARYYRSSNRAEEAERHLALALKAQPDSWQARFLLAQSHKRQGREDLAREELERSQQLRRQTNHSQALLRQMFYGGTPIE
ncbi:MAG: tetratricopeptide repeat protein [Bryobacteraceae bacterium]